MKKFFERRDVNQVCDRRYLSDYFVCTNCNYGMYKKVLGDTTTCPECGGTMRRK